MPTVYPIEWGPIVGAGKYRHLSKRDVAVWEAYVPRAAQEWDMVAYDVAIGGAWPSDPEATEEQRRGFQYATALKIDALLRRGDTYTVVEVKPEATVGGIGGALCYTRALARELPELPEALPMLLCEFASADLRWLADAFGVRLETV